MWQVTLEHTIYISNNFYMKVNFFKNYNFIILENYHSTKMDIIRKNLLLKNASIEYIQQYKNAYRSYIYLNNSFLVTAELLLYFLLF